GALWSDCASDSSIRSSTSSQASAGRGVGSAIGPVSAGGGEGAIIPSTPAPRRISKLLFPWRAPVGTVRAQNRARPERDGRHPAWWAHRGEGAVFVACSTLCFGRFSLEHALRVIGELHFSKFDVAVHEQGCQLKPSQVAADVPAAAARLRYGPGLTPAAFSVEIDVPGEEEYHRQFQAVCRLAGSSAVPLVTIRPAELEVPLDAEVERLGKLIRIGDGEGILVCAATLIGTHTQTPELAVQLCEKVPGLGLTL